MSDNGITVVAVLLADGWHKIVPGSFTVGPLGFGTGADLGGQSFRFEEADTGSPYQPTVLAGPLDGIIAVRQRTTVGWRTSGAGRAPGAHNGSRKTQAAPSPRPPTWTRKGRNTSSK
jgi:hypothetical protein